MKRWRYSVRVTADAMFLLACPVVACLASLTGISGCGSAVTATSAASGASSPTATPATNGPQSGYIWRNEDRTLRPILGFPGGARIGETVVPAAVYANAAASPSGAVALLIAGDGSIARMALPDGSPAALGTSLSASAQIRFSPSGNAALVFTPGLTSAALISSLSASPSVRNLTLPSGVIEAQLSDLGTMVIAAAAANTVNLTSISSTGTTHPLVAAGKFGGMNFIPNTDDLLLADAAANTLIRLHTVSSSPASETVGTDGLLAGPGSVAASRDGQWAVLTNSAASSAVVVSLTGAAPPATLACACKPASATSLAGGRLFRISDLSGGPVWVVNVASVRPSMMFIPGLADVGIPTATVKKALGDEL